MMSPHIISSPCFQRGFGVSFPAGRTKLVNTACLALKHSANINRQIYLNFLNIYAIPKTNSLPPENSPFPEGNHHLPTCQEASEVDCITCFFGSGMMSKQILDCMESVYFSGCLGWLWIIDSSRKFRSLLLSPMISHLDVAYFKKSSTTKQT